MSLVSWPESLPLPLLTSHGYTPGNNLVESKVDSGYSRTRRRFKNVPDTMTVKFLFNAAQAAIFEGWFHHTITDGNDWFLMKVKVASGVVEHEVKFKPPPKKMTALTTQLWQKDASMWIKERDVISKELTEFLMAYDIANLERAANRSNGIELIQLYDLIGWEQSAETSNNMELIHPYDVYALTNTL